MGGGAIRIHYWLSPLSWLYGAVVGLRNKLFDWGWLRSKSFGVPVICVGNLSVGGTGKTPHTEYLVRLLTEAGVQVATLSRGYRRKSRGYVLAGAGSTARQIGDEPCQMKQKFPALRVAVDADRCHGIAELLKLEHPPVGAVVLDDAFQHRYVSAGMNILLTDYHRLFSEDALLPAGRLREPASGKQRAQMVIVTKCPPDIKPIDFNIIAKQLHLSPWQQLYFTRLKYGSLYPLFPAGTGAGTPSVLKEGMQVLLLTGIASPAPLVEELKARLGGEAGLSLLAYADHHDFTPRDLQQLKARFLQLEEGRRLIITTEKDGARLRQHPALDESLKPHIYLLPVEVEFLQDGQEIFNQNIIAYVRKNPRNGSLPEGEDAHAS